MITQFIYNYTCDIGAEKDKYWFKWQCLKWTVAQSPNATNILFGRPKAAPN
jgi:hypothetical protein